MKIAIVQSNIRYEEKAYNLKAAKEFTCLASEEDADLILFPEMSFTGFSMDFLKTGETDSYTIKKMQHRARAYNIAIGFGYVRLFDGKGENHYCIVDRDGNIISDYVKIHSFTIGGECKDFRSGNVLPPAAEVCGFNLRTFICYDLRFPEIFRTSADDTDIFIVAANWPKARREQWISLLKARAIENQSYVIGINCTGNQLDLNYTGDSMAADPLGNIIASTELYKEGLIFCNISEKADTFRKSFPVMPSRKNKLYTEIYSRLTE